MRPKGDIKRQSISLVLSWVKRVWDDIPENIIGKVFLKTALPILWMEVEMTALMKKVMKLRSCNLHGMQIRRFQKNGTTI